MTRREFVAQRELVELVESRGTMQVDRKDLVRRRIQVQDHGDDRMADEARADNRIEVRGDGYNDQDVRGEGGLDDLEHPAFLVLLVERLGLCG